MQIERLESLLTHLLESAQIVFATGYHRELPFTVNGKEFRFPEQPLFKYTFSPGHQQLGFCLYMHSIGSFQVSWMQAKWIVSVLAGKVALPPQKVMHDKAVALEEHQGKGASLEKSSAPSLLRTNRHTHTHRQTDRRTDGQTDRDTDRQVDRQTER